MPMKTKEQSGEDSFHEQVRSRFGVLPNFFCTAASAPGLIKELWGFAKSAYLDSPLPSLFKERLFVHLSRFCAIRYCIVRHVGFLVGEGRPAGDALVPAETVEQAIALLSRPVPHAAQLNASLSLLERVDSALPIPEPRTELEGALFDALTIQFIDPRGAERTRAAVTRAFGETNFEILTAFLAFVRTAHYWTETHPTLGFEDDMLELMRKHPTLARLMLDSSEAEWASSRQALRRALDELRTTAGALRSTEGRFHALITATSEIVYQMNHDWSELTALDGRGSISNTTSPDSNWLERYIPASERSKVTSAIRAAQATRSMFELEHRVIRVDGTEGWVLSRAIPIVNSDGEVAEWFGAALDITARRKAEDSLREADRRKDEFLATLSHELRNPLAPLRNGLQIARLNSQPDTPFGRTIDMMERQVGLLVHLVDDLLDVSRIRTGKFQLRKTSVALHEALTAAVESARSHIDSRDHLLSIEAPDERLTVNGDADRLVQIFWNLLSNAAKYSERGGRIDIRMHREGQVAVVSVSDTGIGIQEGDLPRVFDIFSQVHSQEWRSDGGLGIGLALVKQLVEMHGGTVAASSPGPGNGSTFTVRLPLLAAAEAVSDVPTGVTHETFSNSCQRVLVVDDNVDAANSLSMLLGGMGHDVVTAHDGPSAIAKATEFAPDFVLLDLGMPGMNGIETAVQLRKLPCRSGTC